MNKSELRFMVEQTGSLFFTLDTMKFFGDTMGNYYVSKKTVVVGLKIVDWVAQ